MVTSARTTEASLALEGLTRLYKIESSRFLSSSALCFFSQIYWKNFNLRHLSEIWRDDLSVRKIVILHLNA